MPNIDSSVNEDISNKFENLHSTHPTSLESLTGQQTPLLSSRDIHSDPEETQAKTKTKSRFSTALRKLSRVKKEKPIITEFSESILSSGNEDSTESNLLSESEKKTQKKKKTTTSIFGLKKTKVTPKYAEGSKIERDTKEDETSRLLEPIFHDTENEVEVTTTRLSPHDSRRTVQITIKSKKIETVASQEHLKSNPPSLSSAQPPTLTTTTSTTTTTTTTTEEASKPKSVATLTIVNDEPLDNKNKLKTKVTTPTPQKSNTTIVQSKSKQKQQEEQEKIVITQSSKDTPPKERAPTKPSRLTTIPTSQPSATSGAVRKAATTTKAAIKLVTAAKSKKKSSTKPPKGPTNTNSNSPTAIQKEADLMINPQRGHRLPKPTIATTTISKVTQPQELTTPADETQGKDTATTAALTTNTKDQQQMQQTEKSPDCLAAILPQTAPIEIQSSITNASLQTTNKSNETIKQRENIQTSPIDNSVRLKTFQQTDDHISLAESVKPIDYSADNPYDSRETIPVPVSVEFAVGSPVRPPLQQPLYEFSIQESSIISQKDNDSESSPISETIRRRIQYIAQPTLYDEFNSLELKRAHYRYQSGVSDLSLDLDDNVDTFDDLQQMPAFGDLTMDQDTEPTIMTSSNTEKREHLYKILVIGELGTGKTSFIKRYVHQFFSQNYRATIGVDFALKVLHWDPNTIVRLQLWDIAGQERFGNMTRVYYKEAVGAFIVFDVTRSGTFDCVSKWKEDLDSKVQLPDGNPIPCILLANKCDQDKQGVVTNTEKMDEYVKEHGFAGWFETSAKENINIDEAARALVNKILLNDKLISAADLADSEKFNLNNSGDQTITDGKSKCSC